MPCTQGTVSNIGRKWFRNIEIEPKARPGKRRKTTEEEDIQIIEVRIHYKFNSVDERMAKLEMSLT